MVIIEYQQAMNAKPDENGITVLRGRDGKKTVYIAEKDGKRFWASTKEAAVRNIEHA